VPSLALITTLDVESITVGAVTPSTGVISPNAFVSAPAALTPKAKTHTRSETNKSVNSTFF